jgi:DNA-binding NarL/FixJ family response regulator
MYGARILVVDDHPIYREGLMAALKRGLPGVRCLGVTTAHETLATLHSDPGFDIALVDIALPDQDGLALAATLRSRWPTLVCVLVSGYDERHLVERAQSLGCMGFLPKQLEPEALVARLARVLAGEPSFPIQREPAAPVSFTERQAAVLHGVARGLTSRAIAAELGIAERTVKDHLAVIYARLDASTRAEAVARAAELGVLPRALTRAAGSPVAAPSAAPSTTAALG